MAVDWYSPIVAYSKDKKDKYGAVLIMKLYPQDLYVDCESIKFLVKIDGKYGEIVELFYENGESTEEKDLIIENIPILVDIKRVVQEVNSETLKYGKERADIYKLQLDHLEAKFRMMELQFSEVLAQFNQIRNDKNNPN